MFAGLYVQLLFHLSCSYTQCKYSRLQVHQWLRYISLTSDASVLIPSKESGMNWFYQLPAFIPVWLSSQFKYVFPGLENFLSRIALEMCTSLSLITIPLNNIEGENKDLPILFWTLCIAGLVLLLGEWGSQGEGVGPCFSEARL